MMAARVASAQALHRMSTHGSTTTPTPMRSQSRRIASELVEKMEMKAGQKMRLSANAHARARTPQRVGTDGMVRLFKKRKRDCCRNFLFCVSDFLVRAI